MVMVVMVVEVVGFGRSEPVLLLFLFCLMFLVKNRWGGRGEKDADLAFSLCAKERPNL